MHFKASRGKNLELEQALASLCQTVTMEPGCKGCQVFRSVDNDWELLMIEEWEDRESAQAHLESKSMAVLAGAGTILTDSIRAYLEKSPDMEEMREKLQNRFGAR